MSGGGGSQSSTTTPQIPNEFRPLANLYTQQATQIATTPWQAYQGDRFAPNNASQQMGMGMVQNRALNGDALQRQGYGYLQGMLGSSPTQATRNPAGNITAGRNTAQVSSGSNPYMNDRYLNQNIDSALGDVTRNYMQNVRPNQLTAAASSGSFGNSGLAEVQAMQENDLQRQMGAVASGMRMQDLESRRGLAENALDRGMGAQQFNAGIAENNLNRSMGAQQFNASMGQDWAGRNDAMRQNWAGNNLSALGLSQNFSDAAYRDAGQLLNVGNAQQAGQQNALDFGYQQFQDSQNYPFRQIQATGGVLGQNMGSRTTSSGGGK